MSLADSINKTQCEEKAERKAWGFGKYMIYPCTNCNRMRLCICPNGKHRCEKCNWVPEDAAYCPVGLV